MYRLPVDFSKAERLKLRVLMYHALIQTIRRPKVSIFRLKLYDISKKYFLLLAQKSFKLQFADQIINEVRMNAYKTNYVLYKVHNVTYLF